MRTPGDPPPPGAILIRENKRKDVQIELDDIDDDRQERIADGTWDGNFHISIFAGIQLPGESLDDTVKRLFDGQRKVRWFRIVDYNELAKRGFRVVASSPDPYHYDVILGEKLNDSVIEEFEECVEQVPRRHRP